MLTSLLLPAISLTSVAMLTSLLVPVILLTSVSAESDLYAGSPTGGCGTGSDFLQDEDGTITSATEDDWLSTLEDGGSLLRVEHGVPQPNPNSEGPLYKGCIFQLSNHRCENFDLEVIQNGIFADDWPYETNKASDGGIKAMKAMSALECRNRCCHKPDCLHWSWVGVTLGPAPPPLSESNCVDTAPGACDRYECYLSQQACTVGQTDAKKALSSGTKVKTCDFERTFYTYCVPNRWYAAATFTMAEQCRDHCCAHKECKAFFYQWIPHLSQYQCSQKWDEKCHQCYGPDECKTRDIVDGGVKYGQKYPLPPDEGGPDPNNQQIEPGQPFMPEDHLKVKDRYATVIGLREADDSNPDARTVYYNRLEYLKKLECREFRSTPSRCTEREGCEVKFQSCWPKAIGFVTTLVVKECYRWHWLTPFDTKRFLRNVHILGKHMAIFLSGMPEHFDGRHTVELEAKPGDNETPGLFFNYKINAKDHMLETFRDTFLSYHFTRELVIELFGQPVDVMEELCPGAQPRTVEIPRFEITYMYDTPRCVTMGPGDGYFNVGQGYRCSFPFQYRNVVYNTCTSTGWDSEWCPVWKDGQNTKDFHWGHCSDTCNTFANCITRDPLPGELKYIAKVLPTKGGGWECGFDWMISVIGYAFCIPAKFFGGNDAEFWCPVMGGGFFSWAHCGDYCPQQTSRWRKVSKPGFKKLASPPPCTKKPAGQSASNGNFAELGVESLGAPETSFAEAPTGIEAFVSAARRNDSLLANATAKAASSAERFFIEALKTIVREWELEGDEFLFEDVNCV
eukprot:gnl/TRDRNA2_/TRDRNA2_177332_c0_seq2.p1 gnl/TRDRNA2_/TRDRNA2_177332_c0~~gnl/TRDRNA2_/TRDRNA2_177332_c0_seq2.p1  ORF type:complete len:794 (+),score=68.15 gnl/TRDRNA2_/TRDRNA2_177332_c0_seq2:84-2465(+)